MKQDDIPVPVDQRHEFPPEYFRGDVLAMQQDNVNAFPPHASGAVNPQALFALSNEPHILDEDPNLADLDGVDYDAVVKNAQIVHLTEVRLERNKLVPVKRDENAGAEPSGLNDGKPDALSPTSSLP